MIIHEEGYVYNFNFHLVFVTKYRRKIFDTQEKVNTMKAILQRQATISEVTVSQLEVMPDHVHMLISFKPKYAPSNIVKNLIRFIFCFCNWYYRLHINFTVWFCLSYLIN